MQRAQLRLLCQRGQQRCGVLRVEKHGLTANLHASGKSLERRVHQGQGAGAVDLDHVRLQVLRNQVARRALGDLFAMVQQQQARTQALGLVHEVCGEQNGLALTEQHLQSLPHQVACLRVQAGGGLVEHQKLRVVHQRARQA